MFDYNLLLFNIEFSKIGEYILAYIILFSSILLFFFICLSAMQLYALYSSLKRLLNTPLAPFRELPSIECQWWMEMDELRYFRFLIGLGTAPRDEKAPILPSSTPGRFNLLLTGLRLRYPDIIWYLRSTRVSFQQVWLNYS